MLLGNPPQSKRGKAGAKFKSTTIRDFDGGWNVVDNELTLDPKFARIFDNLQRGPDGSVTVRPGYEEWLDLQPIEPTVYSIPNDTIWLTSYSGFRQVDVVWPGHTLTVADHVRLEGFTTFNGLVEEEINTVHDIAFAVASDRIGFIVPTAANASGDSPYQDGATISYDSNIVGGNGVDAYFFKDHIIVVMSTGEIVKIDADKNVTRIWSGDDSYALLGDPEGWSATRLVSFHNNGNSLLVHNDVDKPLDIDLDRTPNVIFLGDPASGGSNAAVPLGHLGYTSGGYAAIAGTVGYESLLQFSAHLAPGVYSGNVAPDDATDIDISKILSTADPEIMGMVELRDKLLVLFRNATAIGTLGAIKTVGATDIHDPTFKDSIPQHGTISHRTIVPLGNDVFMCDRSGVPSVSQSQFTSTFIPDRVSDSIEPALQKNINRLSDDTLQEKAFAIYNARERQYMLFMPKYDDGDVRILDEDPINFTSLLGVGKYIIKVPSHGFDVGDTIIVSGSTAVGLNGSINGTWPISEIVDDDYVTVETGVTYTDTDQIGGGANVTVQPVNEETVGYIFTYNTKKKIKAWSRYRNLNFDYGLKTVNGTIFFGKGGKLYLFGTQNNPITSDDGEAIQFTWEWPWGDFDKRVNIKEVFAVYPDSLGTGQFQLDLFVDLIYKDRVGTLQPARSITFTGSESGGFGAGPQPYGGGRNTKLQYVWPVPVTGKLHKPRISGETTGPLRVVALTILYKEGMISI